MIKNIYKNPNSNYRKIFSLFLRNLNRKQKKYFFLFFLLSILSSIIEITQVFFLIQFIKYLGGTDQFNSDFYSIISALSIKLLIFSLLVFICRTSFSVLGGQISAETSSSFTTKIFLYYIQEFYSKTKIINASDLSKTFSSSRIINDGVIRPFLEFLSSAILSLSILLALLFKDPIVIISLSVFIGTFYFIIFKTSSVYTSKFNKILGFETKYQYKNLNKVSNSFALLKIENKLKELFLDTRNSILKARIAESRNVNISRIPKFFFEFLSILGVTSAIIFLGIDKTSTFNVIAFAFIAAQKLIPLFQLAYASITDIKGNLYSLDLEILSKIDPKIKFQFASVKSKLPKDFKNNKKNSCSIVFDNVLYEYCSSNKNLDSFFKLGPFSLEINSNYNYAIVGPSGSGKTTFTELLMGLRNPDKGSINFYPNLQNEAIFDYKNGIAVNTLITEIFSYVPQKPYLFPGTLFENLVYPKNFDYKQSKIDNKEILSVLEMVEMDKFLKENGLNYIIGDSGEGLSTGQMQRIGIARAILNRKKFIVFDECTSNLDYITEQKILDNLVDLKTSSIIHITHKKNVLQKSDLIISIKNGNPQLLEK